MKKAFFVLCCGALVIAACNSGSDKGTKGADSVGATTTTTAPAADAGNSADKGLELIGASDCTTCHRLHKSEPGAAIGPSYSEVAAKYPKAADSTVDRLVKKVIEGGSGVWGTTPMMPHAALDPKDVKTMIQYILSIKNS